MAKVKRVLKPKKLASRKGKLRRLNAPMKEAVTKLRHIQPTQRPYVIEDGVTQSLLAAWTDCRTRAKLMLDFWEPVQGKEALYFGSLFHWLLEQGYTALSMGKVLPAFGAVIKKWKRENQSRLLALATNLESIEAMFATAQALYGPYFEYWAKDDKRRKWVGLEKQFDVQWEGYRLRGMRDAVFEQKKNELWLLETKTAGQISTNMPEELKINFQNKYYVTATEAEAKKTVKGVLYNLVRKPGLKQGKTEDVRGFRARVQADIEARPEWYFQRFEVSYPKKVMIRFRKELLSKLQEFDSWVRGDGATYMNEGACVKKWKCRFMQACASDSMVGYTQTSELFGELGGR